MVFEIAIVVIEQDRLVLLLIFFEHHGAGRLIRVVKVSRSPLEADIRLVELLWSINSQERAHKFGSIVVFLFIRGCVRTADFIEHIRIGSLRKREVRQE